MPMVVLSALRGLPSGGTMTIMALSNQDPPVDDESWIAHLTSSGRAGELAQAHLRVLLVRATRRQIHRLRGTLAGLGAQDLDDLAEQAANDALVAVLRQLPTFEGRSRFTTWAYKFGLLHAGMTARRHAWRCRELPLVDDEIAIAPEASPASFAEAADLARALETAINTQLTAHQRRVLVSLLIENVPIDVLADRLGSTRNALYKTLHDARQRLRTALIDSGHLESPSRAGSTS